MTYLASALAVSVALPSQSSFLVGSRVLAYAVCILPHPRASDSRLIVIGGLETTADQDGLGAWLW